MIENGLIQRDFSGKRALITGGTRGIGFAVAEELARCGTSLVLSYNQDGDRAAEACGLLSAFDVQCEAVRSDVSDLESCESLVTRSAGILGGLDFLIHNAGPFEMGTIAEMPVDRAKYLTDANFTSAIALARAGIPHLRRSEDASIVFVGGINSGVIGAHPRVGVYVAAKNALASLTRTLAVEEGPHGIRVNMVCPGFIDTGGYSEGFIERQEAEIPLRRIGKPGDIAGPICWLLGKEARYVTGAIIDAGGGASI